MQRTSGVSSQSVDNPQDTTNSTDLHNRPLVSGITLIPSSFYLCNSLSSLQRYEAGNKTLGLKGSSPALPPLDCPPPHTHTHPCCSAYLTHIQFNLDCD